MSEAINLVNEQANDEGLWFVAETASEAYLQQALRKLHAAVEGGRPTLSDEARAAYRAEIGALASDDQRERFESFYRSMCNPFMTMERRPSGEYEHSEPRNAYKCWLAAQTQQQDSRLSGRAEDERDVA